MSEAARGFYDQLRALEARAKARRESTGEVYSRREVERVVRKAPYDTEVNSRRLSTWLPKDPARAQVPRADSDAVWALVRLWSDWAGDPKPDRRYWSDLIEAAQPKRFPRGASAELRAYLDAASRTAQQHPPPGVIPGTRPPPLSAVYVQRQAIMNDVPAAGSPVAGSAIGERLPAEAILDREGDAIVIGGPGAGKSCLLRLCVIKLAERWRSGESCPDVPVRVLAADLIEGRPVPDAFAVCACAELSQVGLSDAWTPDFFRRPPAPGARWLVLVDGLDEIIDLEQRRGVLTKLAGFRDSTAGAYRVVVATRPLAAPELHAAAGQRFALYSLARLDTGQLQEFAQRWFTELGLDQPRHLSHRFISVIRQAGLTSLASTPLIATMLCQIFAAHPDQKLPDNRSGIYQEFIELLSHRMYAMTHGGVSQQVNAAASKYGVNTTRAFDQLPGKILDLISRLAHARRSGNAEPAVTLLSQWTAGQRPAEVPAEAWSSLLGELMRRSGLLIERAGDFFFSHPTIGEFLCARFIASDQRLSVTAVREVFGRWGARVPPRDDSFARFIVAAVHDQPYARKKLRNLSRDSVGASFIATLVMDGVPVPTRTVRAAIARLGRAAGRRKYYRRQVSRTFAILRVPQQVTLRAAVETDSIRHISRFFYIPDGSDNLKATFIYPWGPIADRLEAIEGLIRIGDPGGVELLARLVTEPKVDIGHRILAAWDLAEAGDSRGETALIGLATDPFLPWPERCDTAAAIARPGDSRRPELLATLAADRFGGSMQRWADPIAEFGDASLEELTGAPPSDPPDGHPSRRSRGNPSAQILFSWLVIPFIFSLCGVAFLYFFLYERLGQGASGLITLIMTSLMACLIAGMFIIERRLNKDNDD